jgi:hypothetical protein
VILGLPNRNGIASNMRAPFVDEIIVARAMSARLEYAPWI